MKMDRGGDEFLTGPRFTANQAGGVRAGYLVDPPVDLAGRCRVANHVGGPDVFLEGVTELEVLALESFALKLGHAPCLDIVGDHAGHDGQELLLVLELGEITAGEVRGQRADDLTAHDHGYANEAQPSLLALIPRMNPVLEPWLRRDPGDNDRCPGSQDLTGDALTHAVAELASLVLFDAGRRGKLQLGTIRGHEHDRSSGHAQLGLERLENPEQHLLLAGTGGQDLGDGVKRPDITMRRTRAVHASKWGNLVPVEQVHAWSPDSSARGTRLLAGPVGENFWTTQSAAGEWCRLKTRLESQEPIQEPLLAAALGQTFQKRDLCIDQLRFSTGTYLRRVGPV